MYEASEFHDLRSAPAIVGGGSIEDPTDAKLRVLTSPAALHVFREKNFMHSCYVKSIRGCCGIDAANIADGFVKVIRQRSSSSDDCQMQPDSGGGMFVLTAVR